jgi:hypothetical protein
MYGGSSREKSASYNEIKHPRSFETFASIGV